MAELFALEPALPSGEASKYVAAAYLAFLVLLLVYLAIMAIKLARIERELGELAGEAEKRKDPPKAPAEVPAGAGTTDHDPQVEAVGEEVPG